jgi:hypothetical protein
MRASVTRLGYSRLDPCFDIYDLASSANINSKRRNACLADLTTWRHVPCSCTHTSGTCAVDGDMRDG